MSVRYALSLSLEGGCRALAKRKRIVVWISQRELLLSLSRQLHIGKLYIYDLGQVVPFYRFRPNKQIYDLAGAMSQF